MLSRVRFVLVNPSHAGNIGAAARAMKTMGLSTLYLVAPGQYPSAEATARASGADDVLAGAVVCATLGDAVADCTLVVGTSARGRALPWPLVDARRGAGLIRAETSEMPVAVVFGREKSGLTNEELALCHYHVHIPSNPAYSSLNLAAAVQLIAYELRMAGDQSGPGMGAAAETAVLATQAEMDRFYVHLEGVLERLQFYDPDNPKLLPQRLRRLFGRLRPERAELNILRGILSAMEKALP